MGNIYNFFRNVITDIQQETKKNLSFLFLLCVAITIPLPYVFGNISLVLLVLSVFYKQKINTFSFQKELLLPIFLYLLMVLSYFWSIDKTETSSALLKEIPLLLFPLVFLKTSILEENQKQKLLKYYSYAMVVYMLYYLVRAVFRYFLTGDQRVFFYHGENDLDYGLVPKLLNAIHVSVFVAVAYFYFLIKENKNLIEKIILVLFFGFIFLLSSKNVVLVFLVLNGIYYFFYSKSAHKMRLRNLVLTVLAIGFAFSFSNLKKRFQAEFQSNTEKSMSPNVLNNLPETVVILSIKDAWCKEQFSPNDFFPGTAFRVYQARMFFDFLQEESIFLQGFGLNASKIKLEEKGKQYNVFLGNATHEGYQKKNFHNQYIQNFAELGVIGFLLLVIILVIMLQKGIKYKDFLLISFTILMISLFLTESFLWRQRGVVFFTLFYCLFMTNFPKTIKSE